MSKFAIRYVRYVLLVAFFVTASVTAQEPAPEAEAMVDETPQFWFVELASPPSVEGKSRSPLLDPRDFLLGLDSSSV